MIGTLRRNVRIVRTSGTQSVEVVARVASGFLSLGHIDDWLSAILSTFDGRLLVSCSDETSLIHEPSVIRLSVPPTLEVVAQFIFNQLSAYAHVESVTIEGVPAVVDSTDYVWRVA
jgi:6-pyruvoyl-tetrahydropterin synthase